MAEGIATGGCHCGAVTWSARGPASHHAICHCDDCRRWSGAPMAGWIACPEDRVTISGQVRTYESSADGRRDFCATCGTGLFYRNAAMLPGIVDIQSGTLDDPGAYPPAAQIMVEDRLPWACGISLLPEFATFPGED